MKVHRSGGIVEFEQGSIEPRTDRLSFLASALGQGAEVLIRNESHMTYRIRPERGVAAAVRFEGPKLRALSWQFELSPEQDEVWSAEHELEHSRRMASV
jgi:hypothetical protein